ncbi:carboxymuconolactone decarboxylase family protein [Marilutibacter chinensis]|uniref:Carboxymuconolactone decarboxylase family protein n=1 Tax=Marilutibacter chinensis TaxID=2912247 RepID=A0ABS9HXE1_9GAMM|nr:carboxymuconolactone decarboxylase family protein [Lysobacter chinensis]
MSRIALIDPRQADSDTLPLFDAVKQQLGGVPNFIRVLGQSPAALEAFLGLFSIAGAGRLEPTTRERIALAIAQQNSCDYCLSAHSALAAQAGLDGEEILLNRAGGSQDARAAAAVAFARAVMDNLGDVTQAELQAVRDAGYDDGEIVEIVVHVALNTLTNMIGRASRVDIDFPRVVAGDLARAA